MPRHVTQKDLTRAVAARGERVGGATSLIAGVLALALLLAAVVPARAHDGGPISGSVCNNEGPFGVPGLDLPASEIGAFSTVEEWDFQATHAAVLHTGKVLVWRRGDETGAPYLWDPATHSLTATPIPDTPHDIFCSGHATLADGRVLVVSGTINRLNRFGSKDTHAYHPDTNTWEKLADLNYGRWYPTVLTLADGRVFTMAGDIDPETDTRIPEVYDPAGDSWTPLNHARLRTESYPFAFLKPDSSVIYAGGRGNKSFSYELDVDSGDDWVRTIENNHPGAGGASGSAAMYRPGKIIKIGGRVEPEDDIDGVEVVDLNAANPSWRAIDRMNYFRRRADIVLLPDGKAFIAGGSVAGQSSHECAVHAGEIWDPDLETFTEVASHARPRVYHSTAILLPDGRVLLAGGENHDGAEENAEVYSPAYLFKGPRPIVTSAPASIEYDSSFNVEVTLDAGVEVGSVALLRPGAVTHNFDQNQRYVPLAFSVNDGAGTAAATDAISLTLTAPPNGGHAPPGFYMLFVVDANGVPSVASWVQVLPGGGAPVNQAPSVEISAPADNALIVAGVELTLEAIATDPEEGDLSSYVEWRSSVDGDLGVGASVNVALSVGSHQITATVTDSGGTGRAASANITVEVTDPDLENTLFLLPTDDAYTSLAKRDKNFGEDDRLVLKGGRDLFVRFNVAGLPPIVEAQLSLFVRSLGTDGTATVHLVSEPWEEDSITADSSPDYDPEPVASFSVSNRDPILLDLSALAEGWRVDPTANFGLVIVSETVALKVHSRESADSPQLTVVISPVPVVNIESPRSGARVLVGTTIDLAASGQDVDGSDLSSDIEWSSDLVGYLGAGPLLEAVELPLGEHVITASVLNAEGENGSSSVTVVVEEPQPLAFTAQLTPSAVLGGSSAPGSGVATFELNAERTQLSYRIELTGLVLSQDIANETNPLAVDKMHLHVAPWGVNGPHVLNIFGLPSEDDADAVFDFDNNVITGIWDDSDIAGDPSSPLSSKRLTDFVADLLANRIYLGVHSIGEGGGIALRGQVERAEGTLVLPVIADTYVRPTRQTANYGSSSKVRVKTNFEALFNFDLATLEGSVTSAILHLGVADVRREGVIVVNQPLSAWDEGQVTAANRPALSPIEINALDVKFNSIGEYLHIDITSLLQTWQSNPATQHGITLTATLDLNVILRSKESGVLPAFIEVTVDDAP